jgi:hypothetical protein
MPISRARGYHGNHEDMCRTYDHVNSNGSRSVRAMQSYYYYYNLPSQQIVIGCRVRTGISRLTLQAKWTIDMDQCPIKQFQFCPRTGTKLWLFIIFLTVQKNMDNVKKLLMLDACQIPGGLCQRKLLQIHREYIPCISMWTTASARGSIPHFHFHRSTHYIVHCVGDVTMPARSE